LELLELYELEDVDDQRFLDLFLEVHTPHGMRLLKFLGVLRITITELPLEFLPIEFKHTAFRSGTLHL
jgi:hypothetical protein